MLIFGDSITWGIGDDKKGGWVERLKLEILKKGFTVYNCGIGGDTTKEIKERILTEFKSRTSFNPDGKVKVIISIGTNDARYLGSELKPQLTKEQFKKNIIEMYNILKNEKSFNTNQDLIFIGPTTVDESITQPWKRGRYWKNDRIKEFSEIIQEICKEKDLTFLNLLELLEKDDILDGVHPNSIGHQKIFLKIKNLLENKNIIIE